MWISLSELYVLTARQGPNTNIKIFTGLSEVITLFFKVKDLKIIWQMKPQKLVCKLPHTAF